MGDKINLGLAGVIPGQVAVGFGPQGYSYRIHEEGLHADMLTRAGVLKAAGWVGECSPIGKSPKSEINATYSVSLDPSSPSSDVATTWELDVQMANVPAIESEAYITYRNSIAADEDEAALIDNQMALATTDIADFTSWPTTRKLWYISINQNKPVQEMRPVLTKISVYPHGTSFAGDWVDIGKIWTTAQIEAVETVDERLGSLPTAYWLKCPAQAQVEENGRFTVVTRWVAGHYESHMYTFKT